MLDEAVLTVLIVEDNAGMRRLLRRAIESVAETIWECADGSDALPSYIEHRPAVVLMDIRIPRMDGIASTRQIRQFDPTANIVMVTDYEDEGLRKAAQAAGACAYFLKFNLVDLAEAIRAINNGR